MATLRLEIISAERVVYSDDVDVVVAPGVEGQLGILPSHAPLMTILQPGELLVRKGEKESYLVVSGGYLEVFQNKVIVLSDAAEHAEEIDIARAEAARHRAQERLEAPGADLVGAEAALRRALARLRVAERRRRRPQP